MTLFGLRRPDAGPARATGRARAARTIYLVSTSGHPNYGDEIILRRWLRLLARTEPEADVWVDSPAPGPTATLFAGDHPRLRTTDTLFRLSWEAPSDDPREVAAFVRRAMSDPGEAPRWIPGIELLRTVDVLHVVGGGYVNTVWPRHLGLVAGAGWVARHTDARVGGTGLGLLPCTEAGREVWRDDAAAFDVLTVRDPASLEVLQGAGSSAVHAPDDVFLGGLGSAYHRAASQAPDVMVCVQSDMHDEDPARLTSYVRDVLKHWGALDRGVGFVECIPRVDRVVYDALRDEVPRSRFYPLWELLSEGFPARPGQRWISTRRHAHLLAAAAGAEGVALSVDDDYHGVQHAAVAGLGSGWTLARPGDAPAEPGSPGRLPAQAEPYAATLLSTARRLYRH